MRTGLFFFFSKRAFFSDKVGKLASLYCVSFPALPFLTSRYKEVGQRRRPSVKRSVASVGLLSE